MNLIPNVNGTVKLSGGSCKPALPLTFAGDCPFAAQFAMVQSDAPVLTFETDPTLPAEGYRMTVTEEHISVSSADEAGAYYAVQSLFRLLDTDGELPCGELADSPKYSHRGFMMDVSRHFFSVEEVKKILVQCAKLKLNVFHWHLSDDQGFRIESKKFPKLNEVGSWREENGETYGGFYTQEEIRDIVAFAAEHHIMVIPEIDLPGHTSAIIAAYPELSCSGEPTTPKLGAGIFPQILCGGSEKVYEFLFALLDEVCDLFPAPYFHIGGDEAPKSEWEKCPHCQAEMKKLGLQNEEELQAHFAARLADYLATKGKAVIGWCEMLASGKMRDDTLAQYWTPQGAEYSAKEAEKGRKFIFSNVSSFYFDYDHAIITLRATYGYEPSILPGQEIAKEQVLGLEAPLWTEYVATNERLETLLFPRIAALAENAWTSEKNFEDFSRRVKVLEPVWKKEGIAYLPIEQADVYGDRYTERAANAAIEQLTRWGVLSKDKSKSDSSIPEGMLSNMPQVILGMFSDTYTAEQKQRIGECLKEKLTQ